MDEGVKNLARIAMSAKKKAGKCQLLILGSLLENDH
jgi:hypothetical protein